MDRVWYSYALLADPVHNSTGEFFNGHMWRRVATITLICHATSIRYEYRLWARREADDITDNAPRQLSSLALLGLRRKSPRSFIPVNDFIPSRLLRHSSLARVLSSTFIRMLHPGIQSSQLWVDRPRWCTSSDGLAVESIHWSIMMESFQEN